MKTLYESILRSTNSGKTELVKKWCDENFWQSPNDTPEYAIDAQGRIVNYGKKNLSLELVKEKIPDYIRFGEITQNMFFSDALKYMSQEQIPPKIDGVVYIDGKIETIPSCKIYSMHGVYINAYPQKLNHIEPIEIECHTTNGGNHKSIINLDLTQIEVDDLKNIHVTGEVYDLYIKKTPAAKELQRTVKKLDKKAIKDGYVPGLDTVATFENYLNEIFNEKDWPGLRFIYLSDRTMLEHNPKTQHWYLV